MGFFDSVDQQRRAGFSQASPSVTIFSQNNYLAEGAAVKTEKHLQMRCVRGVSVLDRSVQSRA
jgi:hypothetical protein